MSSFWPMPGQGPEEKNPGTVKTQSKARQDLLDKGPGHESLSSMKTISQFTHAFTRMQNAEQECLTVYRKKGGLSGAFEAVAKMWPVHVLPTNSLDQLIVQPYGQVSNLIDLIQDFKGKGREFPPRLIVSIPPKGRAALSLGGELHTHTQDALRKIGKPVCLLTPVDWTPPQV